MSEAITFRFDVDGTDFTSAGQASVQVKKNLRQLGISPEVIRRVSIAMYEGEINMVIHAGGGEAEVTVTESSIKIVLASKIRIFIDNNKENVRKEEKKLRKQWESERNKLLKLTENKCKKREDACEKKINELQKEIVKLSNDLKNSKKEKNAKVKPITTSKIKPVKRVKNEKASK